MIFTAFFASANPDKITEYRRYLGCGQRALSITIPDARYVVLTDRETAPFLESDFDVSVVAPSDTPLMRKMIVAQLNFERSCQDELSVLAAPDCAVSRGDLPDSIKHPFVVTYRRPPHRINNVAFCRDHDRAVWFLRKALAHLDEIGLHKVGLGHPDQEIESGHHLAQDWGGDMIAWEHAVGPWARMDGGVSKIGVSEDGLVHLYPCASHNHFVRRTGGPKRLSFFAYMLHFKGYERKSRMDEFIEVYLPDWVEKRERFSKKDWQKIAAGVTKRELSCE